jgi:hypothetical protein
MVDGKIPCVILIYDNVEIIKRSLTSLQKFRDRLSIHVIENPSEYTSHYIKPAMLSLLNSGLIDSYNLFDENITNNAFEVFIGSESYDLWSSEYIIITDGDVVADGDWLNNQIAVLEKHKDVFCCSIKMSLDGWSVGLKERFGSARSENDDYIEINSGIWLCMFRTAEFKFVFNLFVDNKFRFRDGPINRFAYEYLRKKWVSTKNSLAFELTRSGFSNPSYRLKKNKLISDHGNIINFWNHNKVCGFTTFSNKECRYVVSKSNDWSRLEHEFIHEDWLVNNLDKFSLDVLYFGVNIKNKISGMATIGNSDTRSFYDKESNTCHIRADIGSNLPSINSAFNVIVFYMNLHYYINNSEVICRFLMFAYDALRFDGEIRIVLPHKNNFVDFLLEYPEIVSYLNFCGFSGLSQEKFNPQIDLLPTSRYDAAYIIKAIK